ncbi:MAG: response regulator [Leptolyngbya sp. Prado105]|nr:response regulator [Leptolyngbya sp. Prado105]
MKSSVLAGLPYMPTFSQIDILIVDDDPDTRDLLQFMLEDEGAIVSVAHNAKAALSLLEKQLPRLLVSDVAMPEMDGFELIGRVRELPQGDLLPAIALTAYARDEDRQQALDCGFNDYLTKPIDPIELVRVVRQYCTNL